MSLLNINWMSRSDTFLVSTCTKQKKKINERLNNQSHFFFHSNEWSKEGFAEEGVAGADHLSL